MGISGELWGKVVSDTNHLMSHIEISRLNKVNKSLFPLKLEVNIIYFEYRKKSILLLSLRLRLLLNRSLFPLCSQYNEKVVILCYINMIYIKFMV